ncbi:hypothetical protein TYRP_022252, partial [Tyrophagus putrescentiae]
MAAMLTSRLMTKESQLMGEVMADTKLSTVLMVERTALPGTYRKPFVLLARWQGAHGGDGHAGQDGEDDHQDDLNDGDGHDEVLLQ